MIGFKTVFVIIVPFRCWARGNLVTDSWGQGEKLAVRRTKGLGAQGKGSLMESVPRDWASTPRHYVYVSNRTA